MERQRCVMGALAKRANPMEMLPRFESLAAATEKNIKTDIPAELFPAFAELGLRVKDATLTSLAFTNDVIPDRTDPDYDHIHTLVQEALNPAPDLDESIEASANANSGDDTEEATESTDTDESSESGGTDEAATDESTDPTEEPDPEEPVDVSTAC
jgi:anionic cell wall polymer biosynthesis LytR-Cps2A-Psr (LCP) family protein